MRSLKVGAILCLYVSACRAVTACLIEGFFSELSDLVPDLDEPGREYRPGAFWGASFQCTEAALKRSAINSGIVLRQCTQSRFSGTTTDRDFVKGAF